MFFVGDQVLDSPRARDIETPIETLPAHWRLDCQGILRNFQRSLGMKQKKNMKNGIRKQVLETLWRRELTADERALLELHLTGDEDQRLFFEEEEGLSRLLAGVSDAPLSSNFTARVLTAVQLEAARTARAGGAFGMAGSWRRFAGCFRRSWTTQTAVAGLMLAVGLSAFYGIKSYHRHQLIQTLATVTKVPTMPEIEVLQDFDAIRHLGRIQVSKSTMEKDAALFAALQ